MTTFDAFVAYFVHSARAAARRVVHTCLVAGYDGGLGK